MNGDEDQLKQVFINVIKNACEAMSESEKRELTINILSDQNNFIIEFSDIGNGIFQKKIKAKSSLHSSQQKISGKEQDSVSQFLTA